MFPEEDSPPRAPAHRLWFAGLVAAAAAPLAYWVVVFVIEYSVSGWSVTEEAMRALGMTAMFGFPLSFLVMLVFGYPLTFFLRKVNRLSAINVCSGALIIGATVAGALTKAAFRTNPIDIVIPLLGAAVGLFAGIVFSLAAGLSFRRTTP